MACKSQDILREAASLMHNCQLNNNLISKDTCYEDLLLKLINNGKLNMFNSFDTLIHLETYNIEGGSFYGEIWDGRNKNITYTFRNGKFVFNEPSTFTNYMKQLIKEWDVDTIRYEEKTNVTLSPYIIVGSRIIKFKNSMKVDCIKFKEFFSLERDR